MKTLSAIFYFNLALYFFYPQAVPAQTQDEEEVAFFQQMNTVFQGVNLGQVPSGILTDYGFGFINPANFNGQTLHDSNKVDLQRWRFLYGAMEVARVNSNYTLPGLEQVNQQIQNISRTPQTIHLAVGYFSYHRIKSTAISQNLMYVSNNRLYDTPGRTQSPYEAQEAFAVSPLVPFVKEGAVQFIFRSDLHFNNTGKTVSQLQINAGSGWQTAQWNTPLTVNLTASTTNRTIQFRITYTDGTQRLSHALVKVESAAPAARYAAQDVMVNFPTNQLAGFQNVANTARLFEGQASRATVTVAWGGNGARVLDRPLIVLEGFDGWRILNPDDPNNAQGTNYDFNNDFITDMDGSLRNGTAPFFNLNDQLDNAGYDLIFVDWETGTDFIQRNAFLVEHLLAWVNLNKVPFGGLRQGNVVMGMSMGGLIGRYALRDMELRGQNHETRLFISYDAPQEGANLPLGFQAMIKHLAGKRIIRNQAPDIANANNLLDSPAAQQMLFYQVQYNCANPGALCNRTLRPRQSPLRQQLMQELATMGYPLNSRNIAVSNGAECGNLQPFGFNEVLLRLNGEGNIQDFRSVLGTILANTILVTTTTIGALFSPTGGVIGFLFGTLIISPTDAKLDFTVRALPNQQVAQIYAGKITIKKKIALIIPVNITFTNESMNSEATMLPLDNAPGGIADIEQFANGDIQTLIQASLPFANVVSIQNTFSFVPTVSALDVNSIQTNTLALPYTAGVSPTNPSAFRNFKSQEPITQGGAQVFNFGHVQFTNQIARWLFNEMQGTTPNNDNCSATCSPNLVITGNLLICSNTALPFSVTDFGTSAIYDWNTSSNINVIGDGSRQVQLKSNSSSTSTGWVSVTITANGCTFTSPQRNLSIVPGPFTSSQITIIDDQVTGTTFEVRAEVPYTAGTYTYQWRVPTGWNASYSPTSNKAVITSGSNCNPGFVDVRVNNGCGWSPAVGITLYPTCGGPRLASFPNPTAGEMVIALEDTVENENQGFELQLYDAQGTLIRTEIVAQNRTKLDTKGLPNGIYYISVSNQKGTTRRRVEVRK